MYCYNCGKELDKDDKFCPDCGTEKVAAPIPQHTDTELTSPQFTLPHIDTLPPNIQHTQYPPPQFTPPHIDTQPPNIQHTQYPLPPYNYNTQPDNPPPSHTETEYPSLPDNQPPPPYNYNAQLADQPPKKKKSFKWLWITLISLAAVVITAGIVYFTFFRNVVPLLTLGRAITNLGTEAEERFNSTPFRAVPLLFDVLEDGALTADFTYSASLFGAWVSTDIDGRINLLSNTKTRDFALEAQVGAFGQSLDFDVYLNRERMAMRMHLISEDFYGFRFDTFRNDIRVLGRQLMLDNQTMDMLADIVDQINELINAEEMGDEPFEAYAGILRKFVENLNINSSRDNIEIEKERVNCRVIDITVTKDALLMLLNDLYELCENDEAVRAQLGSLYNTPLLTGIINNDTNTGTNSDTANRDQFMKNFESFINDFENDYIGDLKFFFFIDNNDRLLRMVLNSDIKIDGRNANIVATFTFGKSINDEWSFVIHSNHNEQTEGIMIRWNIEERSDNTINTIDIATFNMESISIISEMSKDSADFTLTFASPLESNTITGKFITDETNFHITIDDLFPNDPNTGLMIALSTGLSSQTGSQTGEISYINIDKWGSTLIEAVMRLLMLGALF